MKNKLLKAGLIVGAFFAAPAYVQTTLYGITNANQLFSLASTGTPSSVTGPYSITGISSGQEIIALASRPSNGGLYGLGYDSSRAISQLYLITGSGTTWTASTIGSSTTGMNLGTTNNAAFNFISTNDNQIRVVGRNGNNYIMNATDGTIMSTGTASLSYGAGDIHTGLASTLAATAYTNHFYGADATDEVGFDAANNTLVAMEPGNFSNGFNNASATMHSIGSTGTGLLGLDLAGSVGMDTWYDTTSHSNTIYMTSNTLLGGGAHLYKYAMDGSTGTSMADLGAVGSGSLIVRGIAFQSTSRNASAVVARNMMTGLSLNMRNLVYFESYNPRNIRQVTPLTGMSSGQTMVGIDYGSNGTLYGLGYNSGAKTYQLYTIDSASGTATAVNSTPYSINLGSDDGSGNYINSGFRVIPTSANRIRVIGNNGTNIQLNATTGAIAETDTSMKYVSGDGSFGSIPYITSVAYTGYNGDGTTQMFGYDAKTGSLIAFDEGDNSLGAGNGSSGYINTNLGLATTLSLFDHTSAYNNAAMNIMFDQATGTNIGFIAANYNGDSSNNQNNYGVLYNMTDMLTGYHRGTAATPTQAGNIGYGVPVKDITMRRPYVTEAVPTLSNNTANDLLVYPNPVISYTRVVLPDVATGPVSVTVIDLNGRVERSYQFAQGVYQIDLDMSSLPTGIYSVRVAGDNSVGYHNLKVVKE